MCGIVGFTSHSASACRPLVNGLRRLEYRGYDSAGIALESADDLRVFKKTGKVAALDRFLAEALPESERGKYTLGIAHTRWATHGLPTETNAHPHLANGGRLALVHNGIIENYAALRAKLEKRGCVFVSQTDTKVLAHLIATFDKGGDFMATVSQALKQVEGTYGIAVISRRHPGEMIVARKGSPLVIGIGEGSTVVASDVSAIVSHTRQVIYLDDGDIARVTPEGADVFTLDNVPVARDVQQVEWDAASAEKGGYAHFMLKEIFEQPETLRNTIRGRLDRTGGTAVLAGLNLSPRELATVRRAVVIGCGTSLHAGMVGKYLFESLADLPTSAEQAAEFRYENPIIGPNDWAIALSQSGETADTLAAVSIGKGALVSAVCNVVGSTIAREAGRGIYLHAGPEISVASTKAFTAQVTVLLMMALKLGRTRRLSREAGLRLCDGIAALPDLVADVLKENDRIAAIATKYAAANDMFFLGRGILYPTALEGALKMKEISYVHAEGYQAAELKHGPIALLSRATPVVALLNDVPGKEKTVGNVQECRAREAPVIGIVTRGDSDAARHCDDALVVPRTDVVCAPIVTAVALQLFAYHVARLRGCEIDQPRNLAKSVTVE